MVLSCSPVYNWFSRTLNRGKASPRLETTQQASTSPADTQVDEELLFPHWPPPNPREILSQRDAYRDRMRHRKYRAPKGVFQDSSLYALYRIYEWIMAGHTINMRNELELFWWHQGSVSTIPDPGEQGDPERYAVLSCIPALLVESFNERQRLGMRREEPHSILSIEEQLHWASTPVVLETEPPWTKDVAPLDTVLNIPHDESYGPQLTSLDDPKASVAFKKKNILMMEPHIHFV
ncbi:hypothetical protein F66182_10474 [Fusarium sp. NRRL 66182]|nr:hypothetical protein F66182_10474 [Fusarium sp. NRRL 66182]